MNNELKSLIVLKFGTQSDFAKEMEVDESYVSRVIRGRTPLRAEMRDR
jgi:plasmid maintenance system antidote protein VapI